MNDRSMLTVRALAYYLFARHRPGRELQEPFLQRLAEEVLSLSAPVEGCELWEEVRRQLLADRSRIIPYDLGAGHGGRKGAPRPRTIRNIARHSSGTPRYHRLLCRLSRFAKPAVILELGTALGLGTLALALGAPRARIITIEGDPALAARAEEMLTRQLPGREIRVLRGAFGEVLPPLLEKTGPLDLLFLDGHHEEKATLRYYSMLLPHLHTRSVAVMDDIHWSKGMLNAWNVLRKHEKTSLSVNIFRMGILFFDPALPRQTVTLRY